MAANLALIPPFGLMGAAFATLISYAVETDLHGPVSSDACIPCPTRLTACKDALLPRAGLCRYPWRSRRGMGHCRSRCALRDVYRSCSTSSISSSLASCRLSPRSSAGAHMPFLRSLPRLLQRSSASASFEGATPPTPAEYRSPVLLRATSPPFPAEQRQRLPLCRDANASSC